MVRHLRVCVIVAYTAPRMLLAEWVEALA